MLRLLRHGRRRGAEVLVHHFAADAELAGQLGLGHAGDSTDHQHVGLLVPSALRPRMRLVARAAADASTRYVVVAGG